MLVNGVCRGLIYVLSMSNGLKYGCAFSKSSFLTAGQNAEDPEDLENGGATKENDQVEGIVM